MSLREPSIKRIRKIQLSGSHFNSSVALTGDWHISPIISEKQLKLLKSSFEKIKPELIILQGDILDSPKEFDNPESTEKLEKWFKACVSFAPTVMVIGGHDFIVPRKRNAPVDKEAISKWETICAKTGVKLLMDEWFETKNIRVFGMFQDEKYCLTPEGRHQNNPKEFEKKVLQLMQSKKLSIDGSDLSTSDTEAENASAKKKLNWFVSHGPEMTEGATEILARRFDVMSFGHTHGGCVPIVLDRLVDGLHLHGGIVSPTHRPLPRNVRGVKKVGVGADVINMNVTRSRKVVFDDDLVATKIINPGMVAVQNCGPKPLQYLNCLKSAEITWVKI